MPPKRFTFGALKAKDVMTLAGTSCGITAIILALEGIGAVAFFMIFLGAGFDLLDGYVARRFHQVNKIGVELDSLSDAIVFAVAPAIVTYSEMRRFFMAQAFPVGAYIVLVVGVAYFIICGITRLAWFNVDEDNEGYTGLVTPISALYIILYFFIWHYFSYLPNTDAARVVFAWAFPFVLLFTATMNVSHFLVYGKNIRKKTGVVKYLIITGGVLGVGMGVFGLLFFDYIYWAIVVLLWFGFGFFTAYIVYGIRNYLQLPKAVKDQAGSPASGEPKGSGKSRGHEGNRDQNSSRREPNPELRPVAD